MKEIKDVRNPNEKSCDDCNYHNVEKDTCLMNNALKVLANGKFCAQFKEKEDERNE